MHKNISTKEIRVFLSLKIIRNFAVCILYMSIEILACTLKSYVCIFRHWYISLQRWGIIPVVTSNIGSQKDDHVRTWGWTWRLSDCGGHRLYIGEAGQARSVWPRIKTDAILQLWICKTSECEWFTSYHHWRLWWMLVNTGRDLINIIIVKLLVLVHL